MKKGFIIKIFVLLLGLSAIASVSVSYFFYQWWKNPLTNLSASLIYEVQRGGSLSRVAYDLRQRGVLEYPRVFLLMAKIQGNSKIQVGEYQFLQQESPEQLYNKLIRGEVITYQVTLVEGWTFKEILARLQAQEKIESTLTNEETIIAFFQGLNIEQEFYGDKDLTVQQKLEGWFFPDTYRYSSGYKDTEVLRQAYLRMRDVLTTEWDGRSYDLPYQNAYEALVMASIVERETGVPQEREQIAGVFVRRLQKNMRLATDPTVIYGLGDEYQGNIRRSHLRQATPYNTYVIKGLPPTPIAAPGREAIHAALHPDDSNTLYFVAKGDGSHHFSTTLEEHNGAVQRYQVRQRASNYQSSPLQKNENNQ